MSDILIRGIPSRVHHEIQRLAEMENLSLNQFLVRQLVVMVKRNGEKEAEEERRKDVFRRIDELREELYRKYGRFDDSTKLIREDRDSR